MAPGFGVRIRYTRLSTGGVRRMTKTTKSVLAGAMGLWVAAMAIPALASDAAAPQLTAPTPIVPWMTTKTTSASTIATTHIKLKDQGLGAPVPNHSVTPKTMRANGIGTVHLKMKDSAIGASVPHHGISKKHMHMGAVPTFKGKVKHNEKPIHTSVPKIKPVMKMKSAKPKIKVAIPGVKIEMPKFKKTEKKIHKVHGVKVVHGRKVTKNVFIKGGSTYVYSVNRNPVCVDRLNVAVDPSLLRRERALRAVCLDDKGSAHPASRLDPAKHVAENYEGELYRCVVGTRLSATIGTIENGVSKFDGGVVLDCEKGEALRHRAGELYCAPQEKKRQCFERSLLRKHGPGEKLLSATIEDGLQVGGLCLDGGVGGGLPY